MHLGTSTLKAIGVACLGLASFSLMDAAMKYLSLELTPYNALFWRSLLGVPIGGAAMLFSGARLPDRSTLKLQALRAVISVGMAWLFFIGVTLLPLAEGIALSFIAPLIALYLAALLLGESIGKHAIGASLMGLVGVGIILSGQLGGEESKPDAAMGAAAIFGSAVLYAYCLVLQRRLAQLAHPAALALVQNLFMAMVLALFAPWLASVPALSYWPMLFVASALAILAILLLSWAYARAEAQVLIPVEYTAFLWAALCGWQFFGERVTIATLAGAAVIIAACLVAAQSKPSLAAKEDSFV